MIKKIYLLIILFIGLFVSVNAYCVPAKPGIIEFRQPDGTTLSIYLQGDEYLRSARTIDGYTLLFNEDGYYEYAVLDNRGDLVPSGVIAREIINRTITESSFLENISTELYYSVEQISYYKQLRNVYESEAKSTRAFPTSGSRKLLCILIGYTDKAFTKTQSDFNMLFNQIGYSVGGATGSVKDYYLENSYGLFNLSVDVAGPYTASNTMAYYGTNSPSSDYRVRDLVTEAVTLANPDVNYADYDNDANGSVDGIYIIYAGYGEEAGGGLNAIWAHAWAISTLTFDSKTISKYSCSSELSGSSGSSITRIGVICHEFGHVLGAPDYYDTNYGTDNQYDGTGEWDMMAGGSWNNGGATPAHHNAYTKISIYGWAMATVLSTAQNVALLNSEQNSTSFYRYNTTTTDEYFLLENRQKVGFDAAIPGHGMLIYHVDGAYVTSHMSTNNINTTSHQGMYTVPAFATTANGVITGDGAVSTAACPWPGTGGKTSFTDATTPNAKSWAAANTVKPLTNITETSGVIQFCFISCPPVCTPPTTIASNFSTSAIGDNQMQVNWLRGNGTSVIVVAREGSSVDANPFNGVTYTANAAFGSGTEIGTGNFVIYQGTATNVVTTGLQPGTQYYFSVYEFFTAGNCYNVTALTGNAVTTGVAPCNVCYSWGHTTYATSTTRVIFNTINNASAKPVDGNSNAYSDYNAISTSLNIGSTYNITVNINTDGNYKAATKVWIDWNDNCSFNDPGEEYELGTAANQTDGQVSLCPYAITVPLNAVSGTTRMRVSTMYNDPAVILYPGSCDTNIDGEVEDYGIVINPVTGPTILTTPTSLSYGNVEIGTSHELSYQVAGFNLTSNLVITAPTDFQVSTTSGVGFTNTISLTPVSGSVGPFDIFVKFEPQTAQTYTSTLTNSSTGATTKNITLNGVGGHFTPIADFSGTPTAVLGGGSVTFTDLSTGTTPTSWLWTFEGGTPSTSTDQNPTITYSTAGVYDVTLAATNASGTDTKIIADYITVVDPNTCFCDYIDHIPGTAVYYSVTGGYLSGNNSYDDKAKAEYFANTTGYNILEGAYFSFGKAYVNNSSTMITFNVYDDNGAASSGFTYSPGTVMATKSISLQSIADNIANGELTYVDFGTPVNVTATNFFIGFNIPNPSTSGDTLVILTGQQNAGTDEGWDLSSTDVWSAYNTGWGASFNNAIYPILCATGMPNTDFYANATTVSAGSTVNFTDASTCSPTSWSWSFPGGTPASSATQNPSIVYSAPGVYNVSLTATNANGSDTYSITGYITVTNVPSVIVEWNFPNATDNNIADAGLAINLTKTITAFGGVSDIRYTAAGVTTRSVGAETWDTGSGTKGWQILFNTIGYGTLKLSYAQMSDNATSPRDFKIQYSTNGTTWYDLGNNITLVEDTWKTGLNIALPSALENQTNVYLRWIMTSNLGCSGAAVSSAQTIRRNYMDNIVITGLPLVSPPITDFSASDITPCVGQSVTYTDATINTPTSWAWTFSGGTPATSTSQNPVVTYASAGTYDVQLIATNTSGSDTETKTSYITVGPLPTAPTSVAATQTTVCAGVNTTLSYTGGSGTTFNWYTGSCGGVSAGTGNNLVVTPATTTTTYYGRWENSCGQSVCQSVTITVNPLPIGPTSVAATQTTICSGANTTLSYTGGSGTTFNWYTGSCGGVSAGSGNNLTVSPITTTTYYGRWENSCGNSACQTVTITVNPLAVPPTSVAATLTTTCAGQTTSLSYTGGSGTTFRWYTGGCGTTLAGTGNNLNVSPTITTTYYGRWENTCGNSTCQTITINVNPLSVAATSASASVSTICEGQSSVLSYIGGSGTTFNWYTSSCGGSLVGSGNNLSVSPTTTTIYYGRWENSCGNSTCVTTTVTVNPLPVAPASASATQTTICSGQSTTLSYTGGSGTTFRWYTGACGTTLAGTGNNLNVSPTTNTTYYGRWENTCGNSTCATISITVNPIAVTPTSVSATQTTICEGQSSVLSYVGGSGTTFGWYTASCGGTSVGTGNNVSVSPTTSTTYYGRWENSCGNSACKSLTITVNPLPIAATSASASVPTICEGQSSVISYIGGSGTTFKWYTASCGGTLAGSGNNLNITPTTTTTYYGRWENSCGNSTCVTTTVTVNPLPVAATSVSATQTTICSGAITTLTYSGGSGTNFKWYTGGCGTTLAGTGNNLNVSPSVTTTYYGRWENSCGNSVCRTITINVNPLPIVSASVAATSSTICNGQNTDLTYIGGSGTIFNWYTGSCGGTLIGTNNNFNVSPAITTTYYGAWENSCGVSTCLTVTVTVNQLAVEPTSVSATATTICEGESSTLSYIGGTGTTFRWYTGSCGGTLVGSGNNLDVYPTANTTYYGAWENSCGLSICKTVTVNVTTLPAIPVTNVDCTGGENFAVVSVTSPVGATFDYSLNGGTYQPSPIFTDLANGNYNITVRRNLCTVTGSNFNVNCGCFNPTDLTLTSNAGSTCGITPITVLNNTFGGSATNVSVTHNGSGTITSSFLSSPFNFTYTPGPADAGNTVQITFTTNNPEGLPCLPAQDVYNLTVNPLAIAPTSVTASNLTVCPSGNTLLSYVGGNGTTFNWYTDACNSTFIGSGNNLGVNPVTTTTYYGSWENSCGSSACAQVTVATTPLPQNVTSVASSQSVICNGESSNLSYLGGSGTVYKWYTTSCGSSNVGSGNNLTVYPTTNTTYYGRWENSCGVSDCDVLTITVNQFPEAATTASASITTICEGQSSVLSYIGGSGTTFKWYTASCGGALVGSGNNLTVSPTTTTTYYGRWENSCGNSTCQTVTIAVNPLPIAPTSVAASLTTTCEGQTTSLSYTGGNGTTFKWYTDGCGTALAGIGNNLNVTPSVTTTYYGRWENTCNVSVCQTVTVVVNPIATAPISVSANPTTINPSESSVLSYTGGSGSTFNWYTGSCGGAVIGTGNDFSVSPSGTTTYYGAWENSCGVSTCMQVTINLNALPVAPDAVSATNTSICAGSGTIISYTGGNGTVFKWYTGDCGDTEVGEGDDLFVNPLVTTTYYGRWENAFGNTTCEYITITVNPLPVAPTLISVDNSTICSEESIILSFTGGSGDTFKWFENACGTTEVGTGNDLSLNPSLTTTYYGYWENSCGVSLCESVLVTVNPSPVAATSVYAPDVNVCSGSMVTLSYTGGNGSVFKWYSNDCGTTLVGEGNDLIVNPTETTVYYGRWENTCGTSICQSITVNVEQIPVAADYLDATTTSICLGENTELIYSGGDSGIMNWYENACGSDLVGTGNNLIVSPTVSTTYFGRFESSCGISDCEQITITVDQIPVSATSVFANNATICNGSDVTLDYIGGTGEFFRWYSDACGTTLVGEGSELVLYPNVSTSYFGRWENSCGESVCQQVDVVVNDAPQVPVASFECSTIDEFATITVSEPLGIEYTYSIDGVTFQADPVFTNVVDGAYTVYVEMSGCVSNSISTLDINCICNDPATITLPLQSGITCSNEALYTVVGNTFSGSATELYLTHDGNGIIPVTVITSSPFEFAYTPGVGDAGSVVTITISSNNTEGEPCVIAVETFELIVENAPAIDLPETITACVNEVFSYTLTETYDYVEWSNGSTETTFEMTYTLEGEYLVWVIVGNTNCEETDELTVIVDICENVDIADSEQFIGLYPNPANELSNLIIKGYTGEISYVLVDAQGKEIGSKTIGVNSDYSEELDLESLVPGMYFIRVTTNNEVTNLKLIRK